MIKIFTLADKRPDFIEMQYNSIKKHWKGDSEYIIINNAISSPNSFEQINQICHSLNIKCIPVELLENLNNGTFSGNVYKNVNTACLYPLTWLFQEKLDNTELLCFIDSDMFFINDFNTNEILIKEDLIYMPQYRGTFEYIAPAIVFLNLNNVKNYKEINWNFSNTEAGVTDVGGCTNVFLKNNETIPKKYIEQYSISQLSFNDSIATIHIIINGNINYEIIENYDLNQLISIKYIGGNQRVNENKSFLHQSDSLDYNKKLYSEYLQIKNIIKNKNFPNPFHTGFMKFMDEDNFFLLHYQTGSNYADFSTENYNNNKTKVIREILSNTVCQ